jgi:hypothetical protein
VTAAAPAPPPLDAGLEQLLRRMRLPHMRRIAPEVLAVAKAQRWDPAEVLRALLAEEVAGRDRSSLATRRARAAFPTGKTFGAWDERLSSVPAPTQQALRTLEWVSRHENLVVCGPSGTGKTFLLEALGQAAVEAGKHVAWFTLEQLGVLIRAHRADDSVTKAIGRILRADLVVVDLSRARDYPDVQFACAWSPCWAGASGRSCRLLIGIIAWLPTILCQRSEVLRGRRNDGHGLVDPGQGAPGRVRGRVLAGAAAAGSSAGGGEASSGADGPARPLAVG